MLCLFHPPKTEQTPWVCIFSVVPGTFLFHLYWPKSVLAAVGCLNLHQLLPGILDGIDVSVMMML